MHCTSIIVNGVPCYIHTNHNRKPEVFRAKNFLQNKMQKKPSKSGKRGRSRRRRTPRTSDVMLANSLRASRMCAKREQEISMTIIMIMRVGKECVEGGGSGRFLMKMSVNDSGECTK